MKKLSLSPLNSSKEKLKSPLSKYENLKEIYIKKGSPASVKYNEDPSHSLTATSPTTEKLKNEKFSINKESSITSTLHSSLEGLIFLINFALLIG